jgi:hypothetical protein
MEEIRTAFPHEAGSLLITDPGLDLTQRLAQVAQGRIWLESKGVEFSPPASMNRWAPQRFVPNDYRSEHEKRIQLPQITENDKNLELVETAMKNGSPTNVVFQSVVPNSGISGNPNIIVPEGIVSKEESALALSGRSHPVNPSLLAGQTDEMWARYSLDHEIGHFLAMARDIRAPEGIDEANFQENIADSYALLRHQEIHGDETGMKAAVATCRSMAPVSSNFINPRHPFLHDTSAGLDHLPTS